MPELYTPNGLTAFLVDLFQRKFADAHLIDAQALKTLLWSPDASTRQLLVTHEFDEALERDSSKTPRIVVSRSGPVKRKSLGLDDVLSHPTDATGGHQYRTLLEGSHVVECVAGNGVTAEALGWETFITLSRRQMLIRSVYGFLSFDVSVDPAAASERWSSMYAVRTNVAYTYYDTWTVTTQAATPTTTAVQTTTT